MTVVTKQIAPVDRIMYAEAEDVTGRSRGYLARKARLGQLTRMSGRGGAGGTTFLSRTEVEALLVCQGVGRADFRLPAEDRISYDEAQEITQRSQRYLAKLVEAERLTREGGCGRYTRMAVKSLVVDQPDGAQSGSG